MSSARSMSGLVGALLTATLCACGNQMQSAQPTLQQNARQGTWVAPETKSAPLLLFETDVNLGDVYIFTLPGLKLEGTITGFSDPLTECSDASGNVYVVDAGDEVVDEFSHAGKQIATYQVASDNPTACAVNPQNGDLAVTSNTKSGISVLVFSSPSSSPTVLSIPKLTETDFMAYNQNGELWVDGNYYEHFASARCRGSKCKPFRVRNAKFFAPGTVQWDGVGKTWVVFDQSCDNENPGSCSYTVSRQGRLAHQTSYNNYNHNAVCILPQGVIGGSSGQQFVVGGDWEYETCGDGSNAVYVWPYPAGNNPTNYATLPNAARPYGAAISALPSSDRRTKR
jgi:hypothetical protein